MNSEFFEAIAQLEKEKGIPQQYMLEKINQALMTAYRRDNPNAGDNVVIEMTEKGVHMYVAKDVVTEVEDTNLQISLDDAKKINGRLKVGDVAKIDVRTKEFGRIAAQTAKQVIIQGIREAERGMVFEQYNSRQQEILTATVLRVDNSGSITVSMGPDKTEAVLAVSEQAAGEVFVEGEMMKVYVLEVRRNNRGPQVMVSRTHPGLVRRLFELEVPEIADGSVEIKSVAREAGSRTKIAVWAADEGVDAVGACVGPRGGRVGAVVEELRGEKIDIVKYSPEITEFVAAALSPAKAVAVSALPEGKSCRVIVPDDQLSLAIGKEGQNARLAARLTGCKVDIKPLSQIELLEQQSAQAEADQSPEVDHIPEDTEDIIEE